MPLVPWRATAGAAGRAGTAVSAVPFLRAPARRRRMSARAPGWGTLAAALLLLSPLVVCGVAGALLAPHSVTQFDLAHTLMPPVWDSAGSGTYPLGTDQYGRDLLSLLILGARPSLETAVAGVVIAGAIGTMVGLVAGTGPVWADSILMRLVDIQLSVPPVLLAILIAGSVGPGFTTVVAAVAVSFWPVYARVCRGEALGLTQRGFVEYAQTVEAGYWWTIRRHVWPHVRATVVVIAALQLGTAVIVASALTFLGLGVQAPNVDWGLLIADGRQLLGSAWWVSVFPGVLIAMAALGASLLSDWLQGHWSIGRA